MSAREVYPFLDTPALVFDLDKMEANIKEMADVARDTGVKLRPHTKTQKSPHTVNCSLKLSDPPQSMTR